MVCLPALIRSGSSSPSVRERPDAEQAVLRLQGHVHPFGNVIGDQRRDADAEIDVVAFAQLLGGAFRQQIADGGSCLRDGGALHGAELDPLFVVFALDDAIDVDARRVDLVGIELADLDELLDFRDANFRRKWRSSG